MMGIGEAPEAVVAGDQGASAKPIAPPVHPRIRARMTAVLMARKQDLLALLDQAINGLDRLTPITNQFSSPADTARDLREQLVSTDVDKPEFAILSNRIDRHMIGLLAPLVTFQQALAECPQAHRPDGRQR